MSEEKSTASNAAADENIRQIQVLGAKPKDLVRKRRTRKRAFDEGEEEITTPQRQPVIVSKVTSPPVTNTTVKNATVANANVANANVANANVANANVANATAAINTQPIKQKVILKPKLKQTPKVLLKKKEPLSEQQQTPASVEQKAGAIVQKPKTRKVVLHSLSKRVNKTRHAVSQAKDLSIDHIRAVLIDKKLIKATSKAPESILRQIYSDSLIVAKKTL